MQSKLTAEQLTHLRAVPAAAFPNRVRIALELVRATQAEAAEGADVHPSTLSQIVNGKHGAVRIDTGRKLAEFLGCSIEDLFPSRQAVA